MTLIVTPPADWRGRPVRVTQNGRHVEWIFPDAETAQTVLVSLPPNEESFVLEPFRERRMTRTPGSLSVVVPCFDQEAVIGEPHRRLVTTLEAVPDLDFEVVYIDDGSRDATLNLLRDLQQADARVRVLALSRNFGHEIAVTAGLECAAGDAAIITDGDLQDPPEVIPEMLDRWREGADVVYGVRK